MFLKRIEMQGFKSFADRIVINFEDNMTGVVGPNGCGKSNIADAIRWVLGEQSVKSLRGEKMTDVIFSGSEKRKAQNLAEVTLVFDNTEHYLNSDLEEIEVTRRIYNNDQDAEYLINRHPVRLKDIIDLILDSGLGKDSLSMISQGNISAFAEAKPYDRRAIFEEAAGVAKYKKRKVESINRLERTKENLDRTFDILNELEKQVSPLKRQARKAELYREKKTLLQEIEVAVLVDEIGLLKEQVEEINKRRYDLETKITMDQATIQVHENDNANAKEELKTIERTLAGKQERLMKVLDEIRILDNRKFEIDEKRKYAIEIGDSKAKYANTLSMLEEAKLEYEDRQSRFDKLDAEIRFANDELEELAYKLAEASLKKDESQNVIRRLENRKEVLENILRDPFSSAGQSGVKAIIENKDSFYGVMGVVGQEMHAEKGYEEAINTALAGSIYHIITKDEASARKAIDFLKRNRSGRATFLPTTVMKRRSIPQDHLFIAQNSQGFIGTADSFVKCASEYESIRDSLLGNVLVTDDLENANELSRRLNHGYKIVTLDGEVINRGGSMTGGRVKNATSIITAQSELDDIVRDIDSYRARSIIDLNEYNEIVKKKENLESSIIEKRITLAKLEPVVAVKRSKYEKLKSDLELLEPNEDQEIKVSDDIVKRLNEAYSLRDELNGDIKTLIANKTKLNSDIDRKDQQIRQIRRSLDDELNNEKTLISQGAALKTKLDEDIARLTSVYSMTYEYAKDNVKDMPLENAKDEVNRLRHEIEALGNINMDAPEEYDKVNERYEFTKKNYDDLIASRDKILDAINEMDEIMKAQFKEMFDKINAELPSTFKALFGGGKAKLILEDPEDILNTGIDIDVQPPGKSVRSIRLFSGGEKTLIAICVLFTILKVRPVPLVLFDEVEAALDQANVERFAKYVKNYSNKTQFIVITHRPGTMSQCDVLYGVTMPQRGISQILKVKLVDAIEMVEKSEEKG